MNPVAILQLLKDGECHSGEALGAQLGVSRVTINKQISDLNQLGLEVRSIKGKGYQLCKPLSLLDQNSIWNDLPSSVREQVRTLDVRSVVDSTNMFVSKKHELNQGHGYICLAEYQSGGKGRLGRSWFSPYASNIYLSLGWVVPGGVGQLEGLSLVLGTKLAGVLEKLEIDYVQLKWPNDVFVNGKKIAGILVELTGDLQGPSKLTIGVGLNIDMPKSEIDISRPWTDLKTEMISSKGLNYLDKKETICRNHVAKLLITDIIEGINGFLESGFESYRSSWQQLDIFRNKTVCFYNHAGEQLTGIGRGVGPRGEYRVNIDGKLELVTSGEVSTQVIS